jgi:hypothetical protein
MGSRQRRGARNGSDEDGRQGRISRRDGRSYIDGTIVTLMCALKSRVIEVYQAAVII